MKIVQIDGFNAHCEAKGVTREVSLYLIQTDPVAIGDFVMVHIGYAIQKICEQEARSAWELHDERMVFEANDA